MPLPHFTQATSAHVPLEPVFANLFTVIVEDVNGNSLVELDHTFFAYEKIVFGKDSFLKLHYCLCENRNIFDLVAGIKKVTVTGENKMGFIYLRQIFFVEFVNYALAQNYNDDGLLNIAFQYKIIESDTLWYDK
jgi:hypothetical protein